MKVRRDAHKDDRVRRTSPLYSTSALTRTIRSDVVLPACVYGRPVRAYANAYFNTCAYRLFFLQTTAGPPVKSPHPAARRSHAYCYNCSGEGHFGHVRHSSPHTHTHTVCKIFSRFTQHFTHFELRFNVCVCVCVGVRREEDV